jgi:hypothetical protein
LPNTVLTIILQAGIVRLSATVWLSVFVHLTQKLDNLLLEPFQW